MQGARKKIVNQKNRAPFSQHIDQESGLYLEGFFKERLYFERIRIERSKRPLLMMLLDIQNIAGGDEKKNAVNGIEGVLSSCSRGTDICGWFQHDTVIGILFIEANGVDENFIKIRILENLCKVLDIEHIRKIKESFHVLHGNSEGPEIDKSANLLFYANEIALPQQKLYRLILKRVIDISCSITAILAFLPIFCTIPILIKLFSRGPVLFKQERVGLDGKRFTILKFRTMKVDNNTEIHKRFVKNHIQGGRPQTDGGNKVTYKIENDARVIPIGRFLRKTSLDEFPQFFNVLKGDMSLVGPRPPIPYELENYDIWHKRRLFQVRPGITGLWQVKGRSACTFDEMVRLDLQYIKGLSNRSDLKIMIQTPWVVFSGKGAH